MTLTLPKSLLPLAACVFHLAAVPALLAQEGSPAPSSSPKPMRSFQSHEDVADIKYIPIGTLLADYGKLIGKKIVPDNTVNPSSGLTPPDFTGANDQQKAALIEKAIFLNGYTLVDVADDIVAILGPGRNARSVGLPLYTKPEEIPRHERVFSYLYVLKHLDPIETAGILQQFIPPGVEVNFTAVEKQHAVIVTVPTTTMRTVLKLLAAEDVPVEAGH